MKMNKAKTKTGDPGVEGREGEADRNLMMAPTMGLAEMRIKNQKSNLIQTAK